MNGKQLFCLSLILLSIAMGMHWHKNKPKVKPKQPTANRVALNIDDLQLQDNPASSTGEIPPDDGSDPDNPDNPAEPGKTGDPDVPENPDDPGQDTASTPDKASGTQDIDQANASGTSEIDPLLSDPVVIALRSIPRNPFETSPYAKLVEEIRAKEGIKDEVVEKKNVKVLTANFSATIGTKKELVAVIDSRLYRKGEPFQDKKITEIKNELIVLENGSDLFLIPKVGVNVKVAEDGTYSVEDNFHKN